MMSAAVAMTGWSTSATAGRRPQFLDALANIHEVLVGGGRTLVQGALGWIWARSQRTIPIPGFKTRGQVQENARAMEFGPLTTTQMAEIDSLLHPPAPCPPANSDVVHL
jgi:aryl-alcohol dehydrogenase-like predicted oxidoreductase